ncbi:MAG: hypothetical protein J0H43_14010, partial [Actinobacteria bacterium]|nr:hypothetical protein [Actinomycetota bacterium]
AVFGAGLALLAGAALAGAGPALAKSSVSIGVSTHAARVGQPVGVTATGGDDDYSSYTEVCIERLLTVNHRPTWTIVRCSAPTPGYAGGEALHMTLRYGTAQRSSLRAQLLQTDSRGGHRIGRQATPPVVVTITR